MDPALLMETDPPVGALGKTDPIDMTDAVCAELPSLHWTGRWLLARAKTWAWKACRARIGDLRWTCSRAGKRCGIGLSYVLSGHRLGIDSSLERGRRGSASRLRSGSMLRANGLRVDKAWMSQATVWTSRGQLAAGSALNRKYW